MNEQFEQWYKTSSTIEEVSIYAGERNVGLDEICDFYNLPFGFQWGVYLEFFDSVGIEIYIHCSNDVTIWKNGNELYYSSRILTRTEAQKAAIEKAFEILEG